MAAWCLAHPWMTFFLVSFGIVTVCETVGKFARRK